MNKFLLIMMSL